MRNFLKEGKSAQQTSTDKKEQVSPAKLQVAFVNKALINVAGQNNTFRESVFSTTNGS